MSDDNEDLAALDAAISRVIGALSDGTFDPDTRTKLEQELRILTDMRLQICKKVGRPVPTVSDPTPS